MDAEARDSRVASLCQARAVVSDLRASVRGHLEAGAASGKKRPVDGTDRGSSIKSSSSMSKPPSRGKRDSSDEPRAPTSKLSSCLSDIDTACDLLARAKTEFVDSRSSAVESSRQVSGALHLDMGKLPELEVRLSELHTWLSEQHRQLSEGLSPAAAAYSKQEFVQLDRTLDSLRQAVLLLASVCTALPSRHRASALLGSLLFLPIRSKFAR